jgi:hypothetical protein
MANQRRARKNQSKTNQRINRDNKHSRESAEEEETLNCTCQRPYVDGELVVCCDACTEWFHPTCVALSHEEAEALPVFVCPGCLEEAAAATASASLRTSFAKHTCATCSRSVNVGTSTGNPLRQLLLLCERTRAARTVVADLQRTRSSPDVGSQYRPSALFRRQRRLRRSAAVRAQTKHLLLLSRGRLPSRSRRPYPRRRSG